ncbi:hypothetical protein AB2B38_009275 [Balneola sp. MJW-20]|uniref:hypothetical protein n=1 Tax=Gracilimonas aurantiaca TaxID=3234185 RepID=UPI0034660BB5
MRSKFFIFLGLLMMPVMASGQDSNQQKLNVFIDCRGCSESFIQTEIKFVNFVRDQSDADVHILVVRQRTGSGGRQYTINFMGRGILIDESEVIKFNSPQQDTDEIERNRLVQHIGLGLIGFMTDRDILADIELIYSQPEAEEETQEPEEDPWNNWLFEISASTDLSGEERRKTFRLQGGVEARRVTENWKVELDYRRNFNRRTFRTNNDDGTTSSNSFIIESQRYFGLVGKTINNHWTIGAYTRARSSTQDNIDYNFGATPTIEYSLYPYSEFTRREITFRYGMLAMQQNYTDSTIFNKTEEFLLRQEFNVRVDFTQPWGGLRAYLEAGNYMNDFSRNRFRIGGRLNMRISRGLSVFISANYSIINDQISLPKGDSTDEEVLLNLRQQATSFNYDGSVGFSFNFGSLYNNVVNPRL